MYIHFSVDDVFGCFNWLRKTNAKSIYESFVFETLKRIHDKYGIEITLYCMFGNGINTLADIPNIWKKELYLEKDWLHFGFHCFEPESDYTNSDYDTIFSQYNMFKKEIIRITGTDFLSDTIRIHYFSGNVETTKALKKQGITTLLCADDNRINYGLSEEKNRLIMNERQLTDCDTGMIFIHTDFRVERLDTVDVHYIEEKMKSKQLVFFTHEVFLRDEKIISNIFEIMDVVTRDSK